MEFQTIQILNIFLQKIYKIFKQKDTFLLFLGFFEAFFLDWRFHFYLHNILNVSTTPSILLHNYLFDLDIVNWMFRQKEVSLLCGREDPSQQLLNISISLTASFCCVSGGQELRQFLI